MSNQKKNNEEEVDLGAVFIIIGKGFANLFNFIGNVFKGLFHFLIQILLFLKTNAVKLVVATIIGGVVGGIIQYYSPKKYTSQMLIEPNFKSTRQLYTNIQFYDDLVKQKDTVGLQKVFNLSKEEAASLKTFEIEPIRLENDIIAAFDELILSVDTLTIRSYSFEEFKKSFTDYDYKVHKINVVAEKNDVFQKLDEVIIGSIIDNKYFNRFKKITNDNLNRTDSIFKANLSQLDSLRLVYMKVMVEEAKKQNSGTSIDMGGENTKTKELELFQTNRQINGELRLLAIEKAKKYEIVNVISNFQPIGNEIKEISKNLTFQLAVLAFAGMALLLLLGKLNNFLNNYSK
ncbi:MAG: hypothetical protein CMB99_10770 [Flavobacteriaceae bacterium]|nr:hypothetical protein [Flavobacteriaceae bacterium]|tara:strand:- start:173994 stop:175031 length:1038 start_codon:yes stop_codon:yes gene_type:complete